MAILSEIPRRRPTPEARAALAGALADVSYEVLPMARTEDKVLDHVPATVPLTVTTTEARGLRPTVDLAVALTGRGYRAAPHLAARLVRDEAQLVDLVAELQAGGVDSVFVIGGDAAEPAGEFPDALALLTTLERIGHPFSSVGIGGYPEGHGAIADAQIEQALESKAPHATHVLTQLCFDPAATLAWARRVHASGVHLPIRVGIPGAVRRQKLVRISAGLGLGQSARFLAKQQSLLWRFFLPGGYRPDPLVDRLTPAIAEAGNGLAGFHVFTFNDLAGTEAWRQERLARLSADPS
ncbi:methylenetetrahydrofolate reductase [Pseudonocardia sp. TRM90224]|uniref:methylenetetrahydrofolate reductase n=1 Tax=Pseudonocardia sp. TRM90224 TaxID=2812678 RepID=UPI001E393C25|nr:methylenetetrahydrofolate reductase [Pseudonocardia sp. TRM90224]